MLHVICGPPCAGKTTMARERASNCDAIVDYDCIAMALGSPDSHRASPHVARLAREARSAAIKRASTLEGDTYVIHTAPDNARMAEYETSGAKITVLDPGINEAKRRAAADGRPQGTIEAIDAWYKKRNQAGFSSLFSYARTGDNEKRPARVENDSRTGGKENKMADETAQVVESEQKAEAEKPHGTEGISREEYDKLLAESRKWEKRAKDNAAKAKEYESLQQQSMTDAERAEAAVKRAEEAEAKIAEYERQAERANLVAEIASSVGIDAEILARLAGDTREEIEANATWIADKLSQKSLYPSVSDKGQQKTPGITEKDINAIKNPRERVAARAQMIAQTKR